MKANIGIRRRLAPLLDNDADQMELFTALLLSLPGSPVLYYGDEIGMGDNIWLGDRDAVRTPMQWSPDRNAGFSRCDPGRVYLPVNAGWIYGYQAVNVERQQDEPASLLQWTRNMIEVRKRHPALSVGDFHDLGGSNPAVLAFLRTCEPTDGTPGEVILCVHNLSQHPQPVQLPLGSRFHGQVPVELTGSTVFPAIGLRPYLLTLPGYGSYWFRIVPVGRRGRRPKAAHHPFHRLQAPT
jgi:maltose alpha-D-glucosyltransferase / alpha-amylase